MKEKKQIRILLVEDNEGDIVLTREALKESKIDNEVIVARDGIEAVNILKQKPPFNKQLPPDIVLLDINLPKMNGKEVLQVIKNDSSTKKIPVLMLTTSSSAKDVEEAYNNHANCYITKPVDLTEFNYVVKIIENFWINIAKLPHNQLT